jgi:RNA recognition motif-containing protein
VVWVVELNGVAYVQPEHLSKYFSQFGQVLNAYVILDPDSKQSRGFGYVEFSTVEEAKRVLQIGDHEISGRKLTVENHKNGLSNAQLLQSQVWREQAVEPHRQLREAKAHRSQVSEAGIAYLAPTTQSGAVKVERSNNLPESKECLADTDGKKPSLAAARLGFPVARSKTRILPQKSIFGCISGHLTDQKGSRSKSIKVPRNKLSSAMHDLLKKHLSGSCSSEQFQAHLLDEQNLRYNIASSIQLRERRNLEGSTWHSTESKRRCQTDHNLISGGFRG